MKILPCHQGTPAWHAARAKYYRTASRAPAMMGASRYQSRNDLLRELANGVADEIDANTQALFDAGHAAEEAARKIVESHLKAPLLPLTCLTHDEYLLASFDGINEDKAVGWECKLYNADLYAQVKAKTIEPHYYWQLEAQAIVGNLDYVIFTCSDGTPEKTVHFKYVPVAGRAAALLAGWKQFDVDLAAYRHVEVLPSVTAAPVMALPALSIQVNGAITLVDNLKLFGEKLTAFIEQLPTQPNSDQEFADCEAAVKVLETAQNALEAAESSALAQVASVDEMRRTVALYAGQARSTRLMLTKLVAARKDSIRVEIVHDARFALTEHCGMLNKRLGKPYLPGVPEDFSGAIKGKKTISSLRDACDTELAKRKIEANEIADRIGLNLIELRAASSYHFLFADETSIVLKAPDDLLALVKVRIAEHVAAEQKRLDAERERIRAEEQAKAQREAESKAAAEQQARITAEVESAKVKDVQDRAEREAEAKRISDKRTTEAAAQLQIDADKRALEAKRQRGLDTDQLIAALYERIKGDAKYSKIAAAINLYIGKQKKAA